MGSLASVTRYEHGSAKNDIILSASPAENVEQKSVTTFMLALSAAVGSAATAGAAFANVAASPAPATAKNLRRVASLVS